MTRRASYDVVMKLVYTKYSRYISFGLKNQVTLASVNMLVPCKLLVWKSSGNRMEEIAEAATAVSWLTPY